MMTPPSLPAAGAPETPDDSLLPMPGRAATPSNKGMVFSDLISQYAGGRKSPSPNAQDSKPAPPSTPIAAKQAAVNADEEIPAASPKAKSAKADTSTSSADSETEPLPTGNASQAVNLDTTLSSTIMAMMAQPVIPPVDLRKLTTASASALTITPEDDKPTGGAASDLITPTPSDKSAQVTPSVLPEMLSAKPGDASVNSTVPPAATKPASETVKTSPSPMPIASQTVDIPAEPAATPAQAVVAQLVATPQNGPPTGISPNGTGVALNNQRMKFAAEKKEIAGRTVQKLPGAAPSTDSAAGDSGKVTAVADADSSGSKNNSFDPSQMLELSGKTVVTEAGQSSTLAAAAPTDNSAAQAERLAHLVNQEVVMIRQSGANSLAVSVKLDQHTELFLQLTNHNGQIQASIRCERGSVAGLDGHWGNLQDSLARQNVQLLPLENKNSSRTPVFTPLTATGTASFFNQSSQNPRRQMPELPQDLPAVTAAKPLSNAKTKTKTASPQGWESWA